MLNVSDTEVQFFKSDVEKFNKIDLQIKELKNQMKPLQEKLKEPVASPTQTTQELPGIDSLLIYKDIVSYCASLSIATCVKEDSLETPPSNQEERDLQHRMMELNILTNLQNLTIALFDLLKRPITIEHYYQSKLKLYSY